MPPAVRATPEDEWLWGWDSTPGIVSVWADGDGRADVWRRIAATGALVHEVARFRPWMLLDSGVFSALASNPRLSWRELDGPGALRYLVSAESLRTLTWAVLQGASRSLGRQVGHLRELGKEHVLALPPEEQYLVTSGRTYFRDLPFDAVHRMQIDLETTGLDPERDRIFMIAVRDPAGVSRILEAGGGGDAAEAALIARLVETVQAADPDVIENHNLHGFDLPFLDRRAQLLGVPLALGRIGPPAFAGGRRGAESPRARATPGAVSVWSHPGAS